MYSATYFTIIFILLHTTKKGTYNIKHLIFSCYHDNEENNLRVIYLEKVPIRYMFTSLLCVAGSEGFNYYNKKFYLYIYGLY